MSDIIDIEETRPIVVLKSRRDALVGWLGKGRQAIVEAEASIRTHQEQAIEMIAEIDEIDAALNVLYADQNKVKEEFDGGT